MARALADIITEISSSYNPQRERLNKFYNEGVEATAPQEQADLAGLEAAKTNAFNSITTGANRRGMLYSGVPLKEQAQYVGENYLPSIANLKGRYAGMRDNLKQTLYGALAGFETESAQRGQNIYQQELERDEQIRQFNETLAANERNAAASRAGAGDGTWQPPTPSVDNGEVLSAYDFNARYQAWLDSQNNNKLKVTTAPQPIRVTGTSSRFGSGGTGLQSGGTGSFGSGGVNLQGPRATQGLALPVPKRTSLSVTGSPNQSRVSVR